MQTKCGALDTCLHFIRACLFRHFPRAVREIPRGFYLGVKVPGGVSMGFLIPRQLNSPLVNSLTTFTHRPQTHNSPRCIFRARIHTPPPPLTCMVLTADSCKNGAWSEIRRRLLDLPPAPQALRRSPTRLWELSSPGHCLPHRRDSAIMDGRGRRTKQHVRGHQAENQAQCAPAQRKASIGCSWQQ